MTFGREPFGRLTWSERGAWVLNCRFCLKTDPTTIVTMLGWLAPFVAGSTHPEYNPDGVFLGTAEDDNAIRPWLLWSRDGRLVGESLDPDGGQWVAGYERLPGT